MRVRYLVVRQRGVAMIAVLWLVAAMGLIITGVVQSVRTEAQVVGVQRQGLVASAWADAAILLALQSFQSQKTEPRGAIQSIPVRFEEQSASVLVQPLNGWIDLNSASVLLLADLYRYAGGLNPQAAQTLAQSTVDTRQLKNSKGKAQGFAAIEDLLRVPQMTYTLYAKIRGLVTADIQSGSGRVNPLAAPVGVLQVLAGGDGSRAAVLAAKRDADSSMMDTSFFKPEFIEMTASSGLRLQVGVSFVDGSLGQKVWHVYWRPEAGAALPWRVLAKQDLIQYPAKSGS